MENMQEDNLSLFELEIDSSSQHSLEQASKWAKFLGIVFIVGAVIFTLSMLFVSGNFFRTSRFGYFFSESDGIAMVIILLVVLAIFSVFIIFLMRFSIFTAKGVREGNQENLEKGISSLKVYYILLGLFGILSLLYTVVTLLNR